MCLHPQDPTYIPENTVDVAQATLARSNPYMRIWDKLGPIYTDEQFRKLYAVRGQPSLSPGVWRGAR